jgi:hypothetical protein
MILVTLTTKLGHARPQCFTSVLLEIKKRGSILHAHLGLGNHGNPWENFVLGMLAFRLQGVGEHIIFNGKLGLARCLTPPFLSSKRLPFSSLPPVD